jgi:hypothetical protein
MVGDGAALWFENLYVGDAISKSLTCNEKIEHNVCGALSSLSCMISISFAPASFAWGIPYFPNTFPLSI